MADSGSTASNCLVALLPGRAAGEFEGVHRIDHGAPGDDGRRHAGVAFLRPPLGLERLLVRVLVATFVRYVSMPSGFAANVLRRQGKPDWYVEHLVEMAQLFRAGAGATVSTTVRDLTGRPPRTIESFAAEHAGPFTQEGVPRLLHTAVRFGLTMVGRAASVLRAG
ncbi:hypothetical protein AB0C98_18900 [Streptomyces sp. NPDC048558]|uniref:hypothetical protein n=1 Tax=Streptomyces sp. NPDC048558 TaxID=3155759 RepID=UPI00342BF0DA